MKLEELLAQIQSKLSTLNEEQINKLGNDLLYDLDSRIEKVKSEIPIESQKVQTEESKVEEKVSKINPNKYGIDSDYLSVAITCKSERLKPILESLRTKIAWADFADDEVYYEETIGAVLNAISQCEGFSERDEILSFLESMSKVGEYGNKVYDYFKDDLIVKKESSFEGDDKHIVSKYLDYESLKYRPTNKDLSQKCSSILFYYSLADLGRNDYSFNKCLEAILSALIECKTDADFDELERFLMDASFIGQIGDMFYDIAAPYVMTHNISGLESKIKDDQKEANQGNEKVTEFINDLKALNVKYIETKEDSNSDIEDIETILRKYKALQDRMIEVQPYMDENSVIKYDLELEDKINEIRGLITKLEELEQIMKEI